MNEDEMVALLRSVVPSDDLLKSPPTVDRTIEEIPFTFKATRSSLAGNNYADGPWAELVITAEWKSPLQLGLSIAENSADDSPRYAFECDDPAVAAALMTPPMREALNEISPDSSWSADDSQLTLLRDLQDNTVSYADAREVFAMVAVVALVNATRKKLPDPSAIAAHCAAARAFAQATPYKLAHNPATIHGAANGHSLSVGVRRTGHSAYEFEGRLTLDSPLAPAFRVTSNRDASFAKRLWSQIKGGDPEVGDAAFDDAFFIEAGSVDALAARLTPEVRADLLALLNSCGHVDLDENALRVGPAPIVVTHPEQLAQTAERLARVGAALTARTQTSSER